jgi:hypothetical protein
MDKSLFNNVPAFDIPSAAVKDITSADTLYPISQPAN